jgi:hypothetical protein
LDLVAAGGVEGELSDELADEGDDADVETGDVEPRALAGVGAADADVEHLGVVAQRDAHRSSRGPWVMSACQHFEQRRFPTLPCRGDDAVDSFSGTAFAGQGPPIEQTAAE